MNIEGLLGVPAMAECKKGMGFNAAKKKIEAKEGVSAMSAAAILASGGRKASAAAKAKNPNLKKIPGA